jgi:hypothetical protein
MGEREPATGPLQDSRRFDPAQVGRRPGSLLDERPSDLEREQRVAP